MFTFSDSTRPLDRARQLAAAFVAAVTLPCGVGPLASAQTNVIPPPSPALLRTPVPESAATWAEIGAKGTAKLAAPYILRGEEAAERIADLPWTASPMSRINLDLNAPLGAGLARVGKGLGRVGNAVDLYGIVQDFDKMDRAARAGDSTAVNQHYGDAYATAMCLSGVLSPLCFAGGVAGIATGTDPVKWGLQKVGAEVGHTAGLGCGGSGDVMVDLSMSMSPTCVANRMAENQQRQDAELRQLADQNAAAARDRQRAAAAYQATVSTPIDPVGPTDTQLLLETLDRSLRPAQRTTPRTVSTEPAAKAACTPAKTLDPKTGCHPGHDEKNHPGGCRCG